MPTSTASQQLFMYSTVVSDVGTVRSNNQDSAFAGEHLIAICDGMGGHAGGDTASTIAIRSLAHIEQDNVDGDVQVVSHMMATSVMAAHDAIVGKAKRERRLAGMGTTVTSVALVAGCWVLAHIGDSRAYLLHDGRLIRMTSDHSYVQHLIDTGRISEAEARNHPQRNVVMRVGAISTSIRALTSPSARRIRATVGCCAPTACAACWRIPRLKKCCPPAPIRRSARSGSYRWRCVRAAPTTSPR